MSQAAPDCAHTILPGTSHGWEELRVLSENWDGSIVLKGIQTVEDTKLAVEYGMQGIVVSNHGGRQQDGGIGSLDMLPEIIDAVGKKLGDYLRLWRPLWCGYHQGFGAWSQDGPARSTVQVWTVSWRRGKRSPCASQRSWRFGPESSSVGDQISVS